MAKFIYLAGPINGCDEGEAKNWRAFVQGNLNDNIIGISPLRCEPIIGTHYTNRYDDPKFGVPNAIHAKNFLDVKSCDMVFAYLPKWANDRRPSYGTVMELGWASMAGKPIVLVSDDSNIMEHPVIKTSCGWRLESLEDGITVVNGVFEDYVR